MKSVFCLIPALWIFIAGYSQTEDPKATEYYNRAMYKFFRKNYSDALIDFNEAIRRDTAFLQAYENRGVTKFYLHDYKGAIEDYNKALEINPEDYNTFGRRGWAKLYMNDCSGAIYDFTKALEGVEDESQYYNIRGQAKYYLKDYKGAIDDFTAVIRTVGAGRYHKSIAYYWRGLIKIDLGQKESGCADLARSAKRKNGLAAELMDMTFCK